ncbi:LysR family transcriptional regulator [Kitasatospora sp. NPDC004615]|uniref:LysR family transcriptional regulator n=1 Tax=Kitasatospora sp. NPDC004615 TaxID=3364017 RepID=UPI00368C42A8
MDLHALTQFLVVARLEHLSRAAEELRVAQPSLSRTIARLEDELGTPLFDRGGRLRLNEAGRLFRGYAERALGELEAGRRAVAEAAGDGFGTVRLASETFLTFTAPLAAYKRAHPAAEIDLRQLSADLMDRQIRAHEVDLCVASQPVRTEGLKSAQLLDEPVWLAVHRDHPLAGRGSVALSDLSALPFITARPGHWNRRLLDQLFTTLGHPPRIVCESDELAAIADLITAGLGVGLIPAVGRQIATRLPLALLAVDHPACRRTLTLHWSESARLSPAATLMRDTLLNWRWPTGP